MAPEASILKPAPEILFASNFGEAISGFVAKVSTAEPIPVLTEDNMKPLPFIEDSNSLLPLIVKSVFIPAVTPCALKPESYVLLFADTPKAVKP